MKKAFLTSIVLTLAMGAPAFAYESACMEQIGNYDKFTSEADNHKNIAQTLFTCWNEIKGNADLKKAYFAAANYCSDLDTITNSSSEADTSPHTLEACKIEAFRFAMHFAPARL